jgi:coatomer protein complex subunit epsilon
MTKASSSDLFELKNYFYLGNFQAAINEANSLHTDSLSENDKIERNVFIYRSYIAQGNYRLVLDEISDSSPIALKAVKLLASFFHNPQLEETVTATLKTMMSDGVAATNPTLQVIAATVFFHRQSYEEAMRCVYQSSSLEG